MGPFFSFFVSLLSADFLSTFNFFPFVFTFDFVFSEISLSFHHNKNQCSKITHVSSAILNVIERQCHLLHSQREHSIWIIQNLNRKYLRHSLPFLLFTPQCNHFHTKHLCHTNTHTLSCAHSVLPTCRVCCWNRQLLLNYTNECQWSPSLFHEPEKNIFQTIFKMQIN